ncbi:MAG: amino acid adenylation domain-containing protein [Candidatus Sericytochromatia bacterium]
MTDAFSDVEREELLAELAARGIQLSLDGDQLRLQAPRGSLDGPLQERLRRGKAALIAALNTHPLHPTQRRLWFLQQLEPHSARYHEAAALRFATPLDPTQLNQWLGRLAARQQILRARFAYHDGRLTQTLDAPLPAVETDLPQALAPWVLAPFDLTHGPLWRLGCFREGTGSLLVLVFHHLITDFWSAGLALQELAQIAKGEALPPLPLQYVDVARLLATAPVAEASLNFWTQTLQHSPLHLDLSAGVAHPPTGPEAPSALAEIQLPDTLRAQWEHTCRTLGVTRFAWLLTAWQSFVLRRWSLPGGVIALPSAGRARREWEGLLGCFVNTQLLPMEAPLERPFAAQVQAVQEQLLNALEHAELPFEELVKQLQPPRGTRYFPQLGIVMQDQDLDLELAQQRPTWVELDFLPPKFEILLSYLGFRQALRLQFDPGLHDARVMQALLGHFLGFFEASLTAPETPLGQLPLAPEAEAQRWLTQHTPAAPHFRGWLHQFVEAAAAERPQHSALRWQGASVAYAELNARANRWARALAAHGVQSGDRVALQAPVSPELITACVALLKLGAAYVPLDETAPPERARAILRDAEPVLLLVAPGTAPASTRDDALSVLDWQTLEERSAGHSEQNVEREIAPEALAYVIYTSGSTGQPNGVPITHANAARLFPAVAAQWPLQADDVWVLLHSVAFDYAVWEIWGAFFQGATLVLLPRATVRQPEALWASLCQEGVTLVHQTPSAFRYLSAAAAQGPPAPALRALVLSGEKLDPALLKDWFAHQGTRVAVYNSYGITETTVFVTWRRIQPADLSTGRSVIGPPLADLGLQILDPHGEPVPPGLAGELCVTGAGLSPGYLHRPALNARRFEGLPDGQRRYRSGDRVRRDPDGELVYLGRQDLQIKLRGHRIECGEVEAALSALPGIAAAHVAIRQGQQGPRLLAWVVPSDPANFSEARLQQALRQRLPEPMRPTRILCVPHFPLNQNGKTDTAALPDPPTLAASAAVFPGASAEALLLTQLQGVLATLLEQPQIDPDQNLFELGAHSLLMVEARNQIEALTGHALALVDLFEYPTLRSLAAHLLASRPHQTPLTAQPKRDADAPIAVVGMALRVPGAASPEALWELLAQGREAISRWSPEQLAAAGVPAAEYSHPDYVPASGWCEDIENFAADFFGLSPREAELLDPQQRLLLELAWEACEHAGYGDHRRPQQVGVFASGGISRYLLFHLAGHLETVQPLQLLVANDKDYLATRVAHKLNLTGPALTVQSACSSSALAIHLACESLRRGECRQALAGGVSLDTRPQGYRWLEGAIYSRDGHCRPFDAEASGIVGGSGGAWVVLKTLDQAQSDGDTVYAVIHGAGVSNDGSDKAGYLAPSVSGQRAAIQQALQRAGVRPEQIGVVEAHGTGTAVGDPIEVRALCQAWRAESPSALPPASCALGSIKGNLGHLDAAAGVISVIKATLMLHHGQIAPTLNVTRPHPALALDTTPFYLPRELKPWNGPRRHAAVSSLGVGGTNVHLILGAAPARPPSDAAETGPWLLPLSAPSAETLSELGQALSRTLTQTHMPLSAVAATLQRGRQPLPWRAAYVLDGPQDLPPLTPRAEHLPPQVWLCPGLGSQRPAMGQAAWELFPAYREAVAKCAEILAPQWPHDLRALLCEATDPDKLAHPHVMQVLIFCHGYALAQAWRAMGLRPAALLGHSFGEYLAACLAGMASLAEMLPLVVQRGELFARLLTPNAPAGGVLGVGASVAALGPLLGPELSLAAHNGPQRLSVSGARADLEALTLRLTAAQLPWQWLPVPHAVHHALLDELVAPLESAAAAVAWRAPQVPVLSNLSGDWYTDAPRPQDWGRQLRETVRFADNIARLREAELGIGSSLELGTGRGLVSLLHPLPGLASGHKRTQWLQTLASAWCQGAALDWTGMDASGGRVALPPTPLPRQRHWLLPASAPATAGLQALSAGIPERQAPTRWLHVPGWRRSVLTSSHTDWAELPSLAELASAQLPAQLVFTPPSVQDLAGAGAAWESLRAQILALVARDWHGCLHLLLPPVSRVTGTETLQAWNALWLGLVRCVPLEFPQLQLRLIEADAPPPEAEWSQGETHVAWRHGQRWLPDSLQVAPDPNTAALPGIFPGAVWLITGAQGGLGQVLGSWLQAQGVQVIGWGRQPAGRDTGSVYQRVDVSDAEAVTAAMAEIATRWGRLDGILHAAGLAGEHSLPRLDTAAVQSTWAAKIGGSLNLQAALAVTGLTPHLILLCSALGQGAPGQSAYVAANAWLDAWAEAQGAPWVSLGWGAWKNSGMTQRALARLPEPLRTHYQGFLATGLSDAEGASLLAQALQRLPGLGTRTLGLSPLAPAELAQWSARINPLQALTGPASPPQDKLPLAEAVTAVWAQCLGRPPALGDHFEALGGDSLMRVQMKALLETRLGQPLPLALFVQDLNLAELIQRLEAHLVSCAEPAAEPELLVRLNRPEEGQPLFLVHAISGTVFPFKHLADALPFPLFGVQSRGLLSTPHDSLRAMARAYCRAIEATSAPPYRIGGWSFGALVAVEMARQWREAGVAVSQLVLLDMQAPRPGEALELDEAELRTRFEADLAGLGAHRLGERLRQQLWAIFETHVRASADFAPVPLDVPTLLLVAETGFGATHPDADLGWAPWLSPLTLKTIPGDHYSCLDAAQVRHWADQL